MLGIQVNITEDASKRKYTKSVSQFWWNYPISNEWFGNGLGASNDLS